MPTHTYYHTNISHTKLLPYLSHTHLLPYQYIPYIPITIPIYPIHTFTIPTYPIHTYYHTNISHTYLLPYQPIPYTPITIPIYPIHTYYHTNLCPYKSINIPTCAYTHPYTHSSTNSIIIHNYYYISDPVKQFQITVSKYQIQL